MNFLAYVNFGGNCAEAFARYQEIFGGELEVVRLTDLPAEDAVNVPPEAADMVMNASLTTDGAILMGSDDFPGTFDGVRGMYVNHTVDELGEAERVFSELAGGGSVEMAFAPTFWSPGFGICIDRFGTPWMVNTMPTP